MNKLDPKYYIDFVKYIDKSDGGAVYPFSICEISRQGDVFAGSHTALFWHYSGFAFLYGDYDEKILDWVYETFFFDKSKVSGRFILFVSDDKVKNYFSLKENTVLEKRYFFEYRKLYLPSIPELTGDYRLCEIDEDILDKIRGRITPSFFWKFSDDFLQKGKGYCILEGENAAAWAFSAAVSKEEIDIGIETDGNYRRMGLGTIAAKNMIRYSLNQNKRPVWACHSDNIASQRLAYELGFEKSAECVIVKRR